MDYNWNNNYERFSIVYDLSVIHGNILIILLSNVSAIKWFYKQSNQFRYIESGTYWPKSSTLCCTFLDLIKTHHISVWSTRPIHLLGAQIVHACILHCFANYRNLVSSWSVAVQCLNICYYYISRSEMKIKSCRTVTDLLLICQRSNLWHFSNCLSLNRNHKWICYFDLLTM